MELSWNGAVRLLFIEENVRARHNSLRRCSSLFLRSFDIAVAAEGMCVCEQNDDYKRI